MCVDKKKSHESYHFLNVFWYNFYSTPKLIQTICNLYAVYLRELRVLPLKRFGYIWFNF